MNLCDFLEPCLTSIDGLLEDAVLCLELSSLLVVLTHSCFLLGLQLYTQVGLYIEIRYGDDAATISNVSKTWSGMNQLEGQVAVHLPAHAAEDEFDFNVVADDHAEKVVLVAGVRQARAGEVGLVSDLGEGGV